MTAGSDRCDQENPERERGAAPTRAASTSFAPAAAQHGDPTVATVSRRTALTLISAGVLSGIGACSRRGAAKGESVVLYSSVDDAYLRLVVGAFEKSTGIRVLVKGDTEATKTTGLVERLRVEHAAGRPGADVWWSSEPFLTIALADEGVLTPMPEEAFGDLPLEWRGEGNLWGCFARRARVIVARSELPMRDPQARAVRADPDVLHRRYVRGGLAIARPAFGTTRGHFGAILATVGEKRFRVWLRSLRSGGARVLDGNSGVVRAVASGEAMYGLTDSDDVWAGMREGWKVDCEAALIGRGESSLRTDQGIQQWEEFPAPSETGWGPMMIPNTVAMVRNGGNPERGAMLAKFIMSAEVERALMESDSHNMPVRAGLMDEMRRGPMRKFVIESHPRQGFAADGPVEAPSLRQIAAAAPRAVELARAEGLA